MYTTYAIVAKQLADRINQPAQPFRPFEWGSDQHADMVHAQNLSGRAGYRQAEEVRGTI